MRNIDDESGVQPSVFTASPDISGITVNIDALDDFVALLREEVTQNLRPYAEQIIDEHRSGVTFGQTSGSHPMQALRQDYYRCLYSGADGLHSYIEASEVLLGAAERIAALYRQSDAMADARSQDVLAALSVTARENNSREQDDLATQAQQETGRETRRGPS